MLNIWTRSIARAAGVEVPEDKLPVAPAERRRIGLARRIAAAWRDWRDARVTRRALYRLNDRMLADIGLDRGRIDGVADELIRSRAANDNFPLTRMPANDNRPPPRREYRL